MEYSSEDGANLLTSTVGDQNHEPAQGSSITLPPEIQSLVCGFLRKHDLKQVRQVSTTWERAAVQYLFDQIFMSLNMADLRIARLVVLQFKQYIRTLVFSSLYYLDLDREDFDVEFDKLGINTDTDIGHTNHAFKLYRIARKNQRESLKTGLCSAYLSFALTSSPRIQKIVLTDSPSSRSMSRESLQVFEPRPWRECPVDTCILKDTEHFPTAVLQSGLSRKGSANSWRLILQALSVTNSSVSELAMMPVDMDQGRTVNTSAFSISPGEFSQAKLCFHALTKLRLNFAWDPERLSSDIDIGPIHRTVPKFLRCAVNLEHLALVAHEEPSTDGVQSFPLQGVLADCKFPKLKSLILGFFEFTEVELRRLLTYSKNLEHLILECPVLKEGYWVRFVEWARASLPCLKNAQLNQLYGGFDDPWADTEYMDYYGHIKDFLFAQGENPFTAKALAEYTAKFMRQEKRHLDWENYVDVYHRYH